MGRELGIPTPYNEFTYHIIKAMEEKNDGLFDYEWYTVQSRASVQRTRLPTLKQKASKDIKVVNIRVQDAYRLAPESL